MELFVSMLTSVMLLILVSMSSLAKTPCPDSVVEHALRDIPVVMEYKDSVSSMWIPLWYGNSKQYKTLIDISLSNMFSVLVQNCFRQPKQECVDIDECAVNNGDCARHSGCFNTIGSFHCGECDSGYDGNQQVGCWPSFCPANWEASLDIGTSLSIVWMKLAG